ncbi:hypothetical protein [Nostoc piscinale]
MKTGFKGVRVCGVRVLDTYTRHLAQVGKPTHASGSPVPLHPSQNP